MIISNIEGLVFICLILMTLEIFPILFNFA